MERPNIVRRVAHDTFETTLGELWYVHAQRGWTKLPNDRYAHFVRTLELARRYDVKSFVWRGRTYTRSGGIYWGSK